MPRVCLTAAQRAAETERLRQREFARIMNSRSEYGLSHSDIAYEMGVTPATMSHWKKDASSMSLRNLRKLIKAAGLSNEEILRIVKGKIS